MSDWDTSPPYVHAGGGMDGVAGHLAIDAYVAFSKPVTSMSANLLYHKPSVSEVSTHHPFLVCPFAFSQSSWLIVVTNSSAPPLSLLCGTFPTRTACHTACLTHHHVSRFSSQIRRER